MSRFEATTTTTQLHALIADLRWRVQLLNSDIQDEERKAGVFDPASHAYPMLAQTLRGRRDNLQATVATLQRQLEAIDPSADWNRAA